MDLHVQRNFFCSPSLFLKTYVYFIFLLHWPCTFSLLSTAVFVITSSNSKGSRRNDKNWSVEILTGPVIGKVTDTSARILIECSGPNHLKCVLTEIPEDGVVRTSIPGHDAWHWHPEHGARSKGYTVGFFAPIGSFLWTCRHPVYNSIIINAHKIDVLRYWL